MSSKLERALVDTMGNIPERGHVQISYEGGEEECLKDILNQVFTGLPRLALILILNQN